MNRSTRFVVFGLAAIYGGTLLCIGGVSKGAALLFALGGLIVAGFGVLSDCGPRTPARHGRVRPPAVRPSAGGRQRDRP